MSLDAIVLISSNASFKNTCKPKQAAGKAKLLTLKLAGETTLAKTARAKGGCNDRA